MLVKSKDSPKIFVLGYKKFILNDQYYVAVVVFKVNFLKENKCLSKHNSKISVFKIYFSIDQFLYSAFLER